MSLPPIVFLGGPYDGRELPIPYWGPVAVTFLLNEVHWRFDYVDSGRKDEHGHRIYRLRTLKETVR